MLPLLLHSLLFPYWSRNSYFYFQSFSVVLTSACWFGFCASICPPWIQASFIRNAWIKYIPLISVPVSFPYMCMEWFLCKICTPQALCSVLIWEHEIKGWTLDCQEKWCWFILKLSVFNEIWILYAQRVFKFSSLGWLSLNNCRLKT